MAKGDARADSAVMQSAAYAQQRPKYQRLVDVALSTTKALLSSAEIEVVNVAGRCKSLESFNEKIGRKSYSDPLQEVTDLAGIRVVVLIESDIEIVERILRSSLSIHDQFSLDKSSELGEDRFGYRSLHLVADLGKDRSRLPEFNDLADMKFEIQVRTSLQHAWAEIEHDRNYKLKGKLPGHIKRRFSQLAAILEVADNLFNSLTREVESYEQKIDDEIKTGQVAGALNAISITALTNSFFEDAPNRAREEVWEGLIGELEAIGVKDLSDLYQYFDNETVERLRQAIPGSSSVGIVRTLLLYRDLPKYLEKTNGLRRWGLLPKNIADLLIEKYGDAAYDMFEKSDIELSPASADKARAAKKAIRKSLSAKKAR